MDTKLPPTLARTLGMAAPLLAALALAACATKPPASDVEATQEFKQTNDPLEPTNRFFYDVNDKLDRYTLKPVAQGYVAVVPAPVRTGLHNVLTNLSSPVLFADDVSQGNPHRAGATFVRFIVNSTAGIGGVFDVAKGLGYPSHDTNFGVTLALWGVPAGPFLYLPLLGPSSPRAVAGFAADIALDPFTYVPRGYGLLTLNWARYGLGLLDTRSRFLGDLDHVKAGALDPYATFRSLYRQNLDSQIEAARRDQVGSAPQAAPQPAPQPGQQPDPKPAS
jgi:phospholipid-binding lipoprotein MlaA